jgi:hypothetical protein
MIINNDPPIIGLIISNIIRYINQYSYVVINGAINFAELVILVRAEVDSNKNFRNNIENRNNSNENYIISHIIPQLNVFQRHVLCITMATICNEITINLIRNGICKPLFKVGNTSLLSYLQNIRYIEIDLIDCIIQILDNKFIELTADIINNIFLADSIDILVLCAFYSNNQYILLKLINFCNYIEPAIRFLYPNVNEGNIIQLVNTKLLLVNNVNTAVFNTIMYIYTNILDVDNLDIYEDEHPRNSERYSTLIVIKDFLLMHQQINEDDFSEDIIVQLLSFYHNEDFETLQDYQNY